MSSIEDPSSTFFHEVLVPIAEQLRTRGVSFFPLGPTAGSDTWFERFEDQPGLDRIEIATLRARLEGMWADVPELVALAPALVELAFDQPADDDTDPELSPFVYAMF